MLKELVQSEVWQQAQDKIAVMLNKPVLVMDLRGQVLSTSGEFPFVCELALKKAGQLCAASRQVECNDITFAQCHAGLVNGIVPLVVDDIKIGYLVCTSLLPELPEEGKAKKASLAIGLDADELYDHLQQTTITSKQDMQKAATILTTVASLLPDIVHTIGTQ